MKTYTNLAVVFGYMILASEGAEIVLDKTLGDEYTDFSFFFSRLDLLF